MNFHCNVFQNLTGSIQETPLPPVPMSHPKEPIYEELCQDTLLSQRRFKSNIDLHENQDLPVAPGYIWF
jgi:hypothetical protein